LERTAVGKVIRHQICIAFFIIILSSWRLYGFECYTDNHQLKRATAFTTVVGTLSVSQYTTGSMTSTALHISSPHHPTSPLEYCLTLLFIFVLSFVSLDPLVLAVQMTIQLPLLENISTVSNFMSVKFIGATAVHVAFRLWRT